jgi:hypothetical protein
VPGQGAPVAPASEAATGPAPAAEEGDRAAEPPAAAVGAVG